MRIIGAACNGRRHPRCVGRALVEAFLGRMREADIKRTAVVAVLTPGGIRPTAISTPNPCAPFLAHHCT